MSVIPTYLVPVHVTHKMTSEERDEGTRWRKLLGTEWQPGMLVFDTKEHSTVCWILASNRDTRSEPGSGIWSSGITRARRNIGFRSSPM